MISRWLEVVMSGYKWLWGSHGWLPVVICCFLGVYGQLRIVMSGYGVVVGGLWMVMCGYEWLWGGFWWF